MFEKMQKDDNYVLLLKNLTDLRVVFYTKQFQCSLLQEELWLLNEKTFSGHWPVLNNGSPIHNLLGNARSVVLTYSQYQPWKLIPRSLRHFSDLPLPQQSMFVPILSKGSSNTGNVQCVHFFCDLMSRFPTAVNIQKEQISRPASIFDLHACQRLLR